MSKTIKILILHTISDSKLADKLEDALHLLLNSTSQGYKHLILRGDKTSTGDISQSLATSKIYESHIVLPLISKQFINSDYNFELADFIKRLHANNKIVAIPIMGEKCNFETSAYKDLQLLPNQNNFESITTGNTVGAIRNVAEGIQNVMSKINPVEVIDQIVDRDTVISELRTLIENNNIDQVFERMDEIISSTKGNDRLKSELVLLQSRYARAERDFRVGIVSVENERIERNLLITSLLSFIEDIPEEIFHQDIGNIESYLDSKNRVLSYDISNEYYDEIKEEVLTRGLIETGYLNEIKLILIGNGGVGKTTLRKNLVNNSYGITQHESTVGIEVVPCLTKGTQYGDVLMNIWDFGGQGKYRTIQHFFCSHNSFYLFVNQPAELEIDENEDDQYSGFHYWLSFISAFGYDRATGKDSPVIYVMNKADLLEKEIMLAEVQEEFGNIRGAINVSCKDANSIQELARMIFEYLDETNMVGRTFNQKWINVKDHLAKINRKYISKKEYKEICIEFKITEKEQQNTLLQYLIAVGTILYFPATMNLIDRIILDPNWIRQIAYQIIDLDCIKRGHLEIEDIYKSEIEDANIAMDILDKFELCYRVSSQGIDRYVFPSLFPKIKRQEKINLGDFQNYPYKYECIFRPFIPANIFHNIVVRLHDMVSDVNNCWKEIVVFNFDAVKIVFNEDWKNDKIELFLNGDEVNIKIQLIRIRAEMEHLCHKIMSQKFLRNFTLKEKIITPNGIMNLQQILKNKGSIVIESIEVNGGTVQVADTIVNRNFAESKIKEFLTK
jgi:GTPase SAR1 family protein